MKRLAILLVLAVPLWGVSGCQNGKQGVATTEKPAAAATVVASMGAVELSQGQAVNYMRAMDRADVRRAVNQEGGLEELVKQITLRKYVYTKAVGEGWRDRAPVKAAMDRAQRDVLYQAWIAEKSAVPAGYPDDETLARVYETNRQRLVEAGETPPSLEEATPVLRQRLRNRQRRENEQGYLQGLVKANPISLNAAPLFEFVKLEEEQREQQGGELQAQPVVTMGQLQVQLRRVLGELGTREPAAQRQLLTNPQQLQQFLSNLGLRAFVINEAVTAKFNERPAVQNLMEHARFQTLLTAYMQAWSAPPGDFPDATLVEENYQKNLEKLTVGERYRLAKIVVANSDDPAADSAKAEQLLKKARARGADFADLAGKHSDHQATATRGGEVGWVTTESLLPELRAAVSGQQPGEVVGPVATQWGWQLIKVLDYQPARQQTLEEARPALVDALRRKKATENEQEIIQQLLASEPVSVDAEALQQLRQQVTG